MEKLINKDFAKLRGKTFCLQIVFSALLASTTISYAQVSSIKQLKDEIRNLNLLQTSTKSSDPWSVDHVITTGELANELSNAKGLKIVIIQVGFDFFYTQEHIPGAIYAGPAMKDIGLNSLKKAVKDLKKDKDIVIYCGCCPWNNCPNIRPAYKELKDLGYLNVKVLYLPDSFAKDWKGMGYAVEKDSTTSHKHGSKIMK